jgi:hypothetical protein
MPNVYSRLSRKVTRKKQATYSRNVAQRKITRKLHANVAPRPRIRLATIRSLIAVTVSIVERAEYGVVLQQWHAVMNVLFPMSANAYGMDVGVLWAVQ